MDEFYTLQEIADLLKMHIATVRELVRKGELASYRVGKRDYRVKRSDLDKFLEGRKTTDGDDKDTHA